MAYIRKRNNKFQVIIKKQGYPRLSKTFLEKKTAQLWATEIELQIEKKTFEDYSPAQSICLKELLIKYRDEITSQKKGFAPETCKINLLIRHKISLNSLMQLIKNRFKPTVFLWLMAPRKTNFHHTETEEAVSAWLMTSKS